MVGGPVRLHTEEEQEGGVSTPATQSKPHGVEKAQKEPGPGAAMAVPGYQRGHIWS